jgi:hypothetical protein
MPADPAFWRTLRKDFESLQQLGQFSAIWTDQPPASLGELLPSASKVGFTSALCLTARLTANGNGLRLSPFPWWTTQVSRVAGKSRHPTL